MKKLFLILFSLFLTYFIIQTAIAQTITIDINAGTFRITQYTTSAADALRQADPFEKYGMTFGGRTEQLSYATLNYNFNTDTITVEQLDSIAAELLDHPGVQEAVVFLKELIIEHRDHNLTQLSPIRLVGILTEKGNRVSGRLSYSQGGNINGIVDSYSGDDPNTKLVLGQCPCIINYVTSGDPEIEGTDGVSTLYISSQNTDLRYLGLGTISYSPITKSITLMERRQGDRFFSLVLRDKESRKGTLVNVLSYAPVNVATDFYNGIATLSGNHFAVNDIAHVYTGAPAVVTVSYTGEITLSMFIDKEKRNPLKQEISGDAAYAMITNPTEIKQILKG